MAGDDGGKTVLLVDDDEDVLAAFETMLLEDGFRVVTARSGDLALERLEAADPGAFDLAVIDIFLGGQTSGFQLARRTAELQPDAGLLIVSGFLADEVPRHHIRARRVDFLSKPVERQRLLDAARRLSA